MRRALCFIVLALCLAPLAGAQETYVYTARTQAMARQQGEVRAGDLRWRCEGSTCTISGPWTAPGVSACAALAAQVGQIISYGRPTRMLNGADLTRCNSGIVPQTQASVRPTPQIALPPNARFDPNRPANTTPSQPQQNPQDDLPPGVVRSPPITLIGGATTSTPVSGAVAVTSPPISLIGGAATGTPSAGPVTVTSPPITLIGK